MRPLLVFVDTSVFGGAFDAEFEEYTLAFFQQVQNGQFRLAISEVVAEEIVPAPAKVRTLFNSLYENMEVIKPSTEIRSLIDMYIKNDILGAKCLADASHIASATVRGCDGVVSWNFKHIVHPDKSMHFNLINVSLGFPQLFIATPREVVSYEKR